MTATISTTTMDEPTTTIEYRPRVPFASRLTLEQSIRQMRSRHADRMHEIMSKMAGNNPFTSDPALPFL